MLQGAPNQPGAVPATDAASTGAQQARAPPQTPRQPIRQPYGGMTVMHTPRQPIMHANGGATTGGIQHHAAATPGVQFQLPNGMGAFHQNPFMYRNAGPRAIQGTNAPATDTGGGVPSAAAIRMQQQIAVQGLAQNVVVPPDHATTDAGNPSRSAPSNDGPSASNGVGEGL